jgi:hypothetical protein
MDCSKRGMQENRIAAWGNGKGPSNEGLEQAKDKGIKTTKWFIG